jgi:predicted MFS family arabinose efflux permease
MVDRFGYRSIFILTLVVGVAALALTWKAVPAGKPAGAASGPNGLGRSRPDRVRGRDTRDHLIPAQKRFALGRR